MNFIFKFMAVGGLLLAASLTHLGCGRPDEAAPAAVDGSDAQRLVALLDYVAGDYGRAVQNGVVVSPPEYEEQLRFVSDARVLASGLLGPYARSDDALLVALSEVDARVRLRADPATVAESCRTAREEAVARFHIPTTPSQRPSLAQAEALYAQSCASCHGSRGDADTARAKELDPPPASFRDPGRLGQLSPYRIYNALTFGIPGTAMASFDSLSPAERWSLAFYVFRLGHAGEKARGPVAMTLADMAIRSDQEILETLKTESHPAPAEGLAYVRREAAFLEPPAGVGLDRTRRLLRQARDAYAAGRRRDADRLVLDAYLQGFEPLEPRLRARDPQGTLAVESSFHELRAALAQADLAKVRARTAALDAQLRRVVEGDRRPVVPFLAAALIYLREGAEAALLVGALLAGLRRLGRPEAARFIHAGWIAAIPAGVLTWWGAQHVVAIHAHHRELVEAVVALLAATVLFFVSFWLISKAEARRWLGYLSRNLEASLSRKRLLMLSGLAFLAAYREAAETVLFTQALLLESEARRPQVWAGAMSGLMAVVGVALVMRRTILRLPLGSFFAVSGALLCALAISFAGSGIYELVAAGYLPPRPVPFPEIPWMGIHPDLTSLLVQLAIVMGVAGAALLALRRRPAEAVRRNP